jgi:adenine phosphoribosyltransferase
MIHSGQTPGPAWRLAIHRPITDLQVQLALLANIRRPPARMRNQVSSKTMKPTRETHAVEVAGLHRELRLFEVAPGVRIAIVNILGDTELVQAASRNLAVKLAPLSADLIVTAEAKSIPLAYALAAELKLPWAVLRKNYKPYMGDAIQTETLSITTGQPQSLFLDEKDRPLIEGKHVILVDDVISTGSTLQGMQLLVTKAGGEVVARAAIFTEGDRAKWQDIIALGHLPIFSEGK